MRETGWHGSVSQDITHHPEMSGGCVWQPETSMGLRQIVKVCTLCMYTIICVE